MTRKEILEQNMGWEVLANIGDDLFIVEDFQAGSLVILHFYENTEGIDMVEGFTYDSFRDDEICRMQFVPQVFLEDFAENIANAVPDWEAEAGDWLVY